MAYTPWTFIVGRGTTNEPNSSYCFAVHRYASIGDSMEVVFTAGYFLPWFGYDGILVMNNDMITVQTPTDQGTYRITLDEFGNVTLVPASGGSGSLVYPITFNLASPPTPEDTTLEVNFILQGSIVMCCLPAFTFTSIGVGDMVFTPNIPSFLRPFEGNTLSFNFPMHAISNFNDVEGNFHVDYLGNMDIDIFGGGFSMGLCQWLSQVFTWPANNAG
jgi:hypothetical protein